MIERTAASDGPPGRRHATWLVITAAWLLGRALDTALLVAVPVPERPLIDRSRLISWDGLWYRVIIDHGYGPRPDVWPPGPGGWSTFPFFPLFPYSSGFLHDVGMPVLPSMTLLPNLAALVAAFGIYRLSRTVYDHRVSLLAACLLGFLPGAVTFSMAYPDSLFLASSVWAVVLATERRPVLTGLVALVATAARPNGVLLLVSLALVVIAVWPATGSWCDTWSRRIVVFAIMAAPSAMFFGAWCWFMNKRTGDPLAFFSAKGGWEETTIWEWLTSGERQATFQFVVGGALLATVLATVWRHPPAWTAHAVLCIAPALLLGMVGMIRYSAEAFAVPIAVAALTAGRRALLGATFVALVLATIMYSRLITRYGWVP